MFSLKELILLRAFIRDEIDDITSCSFGVAILDYLKELQQLKTKLDIAINVMQECENEN